MCFLTLGCNFSIGNTNNNNNSTANANNRGGNNNNSTTNSSNNSSRRANSNAGGATNDEGGNSTSSDSGSSSGGRSGDSASVRVVNESSNTIMYLYISPTSEREWGQDRLGSSTIASGASFTVPNLPCGNYDIRVVDQQQTNCEMRNTRLCGDNASIRITDEQMRNCRRQ
jgi:hypothetical protein